MAWRFTRTGAEVAMTEDERDAYVKEVFVHEWVEWSYSEAEGDT